VKKPIPEKIDLTDEKLDQLIADINANSLSEENKKIVIGVLQFCKWLQLQLMSAAITIKKLSKLFGFKSEKSDKNNTADNSKTTTTSSAANDSNTILGQTTVSNDGKQNSNTGKQGKNNGRLPASSYTGAKTIEVKHECLYHGAKCSLPHCTGRVYAIKPGNIIRVVGGSMAEAKHYIIDKYRCNLCGTTFAASLPDEIGTEKYDAKFKALLVVHKYYLGLPFYRMERLQSYLGVPLPDSTQWDLSESVANCAYQVFYYLQRYAAQGIAAFVDDTGVKIIAVIRENKANPDAERKGMYTTAIISKVDQHEIYLFYPGKFHQIFL
jgi:hypothetical protein